MPDPDDLERPRDDPATLWDDAERAASVDGKPDDDAVVPPKAPETVGTGSYLAVSCVAGMGLLLAVLIVGLLISRWVG